MHHNRSESEPTRIQSIRLPTHDRRGQSMGNSPQSPLNILSSSTPRYSKRKEERTVNLDQYSFKTQTNPTLSQLLLKLGHEIFENWDEFCGNLALQARTFKSSSKSDQETKPFSSQPCTLLNRMFSYENVFSKLTIEQQIHLITNFITNYSCYEVNGSINMRIPTHLYKYVLDEEEHITRSRSPSSPTHHVSNFSHHSNNDRFSNIKGRAPMSRRIVPQQVSVLSEMYFQYDEENDRCDSMMVLAFLLDVVLRGCVQKELTTTCMDMRSVETILSEKSEHHGDDSPCLGRDQDEEVNSYHWREYVCDVLRQLVVGRESNRDSFDETDHGNDVDMEMSAFSNDMSVWDALIMRIFKNFLDFNQNDKLSRVETVKEQCKRLKKHFKNSAKNVYQVLQHDMCRLAFVCQNATLFQPNFRTTAEKYIDSLRKEDKMKDLPLSLEMSGELPFITICYWHTLMCRGVHAYLSPLERVKAFHRVVEKAIFPIKHISPKNPTEPSHVSLILSKSVQSFLELFK
ncbi:Hypothetical protein NAEGRDRAFT_81066 [Naegleria gruberi]|uniref:Uncharacterized protein n=1 Tax=Naegleria gruberi TaxID=5762 RepID=D2VSG2_NAEGR|nr:uncharacterized protein NAEGRDRAFT_81066 [Naegleria gruberi]EFC40117.1 Hypothetical protein NAEGRDRAFT_81066 [Naegleria gruberi]|eukprot:XP_002672861.1 Hypothetical protein NAEGRDRAFT_81066 [Naegleria gruberi strain NEG-M]